METIPSVTQTGCQQQTCTPPDAVPDEFEDIDAMLRSVAAQLPEAHIAHEACATLPLSARAIYTYTIRSRGSDLSILQEWLALRVVTAAHTALATHSHPDHHVILPAVWPRNSVLTNKNRANNTVGQAASAGWRAA